MSDIGEAIGTVSEGTLIARAIEKEGARDGVAALTDKGHFHEQACLNCDTALIGAHCHACGQKRHLHRTIGAFFHDLLHGALHFEGKIWKTLPMLAIKPGQLTARYIAGERARYVSPMALFLFSVFAMFAVFQMLGISPPTDLESSISVSEEDRSKFATTILEDTANEQKLLVEELAQLEPGTEEHIRVSTSLNSLGRARAIIGGLADEVAEGSEQTGTSTSDQATVDETKAATSNPEIVQIEDDAAPASIDGIKQISGIGWIDKGLDKWKNNPSLMVYKMQANSYKFSWLLIPLSLPFVWLLFAWKRQFKAYDHAIFVTYSLAFMSLLFIVLSTVGVAGTHVAVPIVAALIIAPVHLYKQLRGAYGLSRFSTIWRLFVLLAFAIPIVLALFVQILLTLGAF